MKLFSNKEDIEKMGFEYEPDREKCKIFKTNVFYGIIHVANERNFIERETVMTSDDYSPKAYKEALTAATPFTHVHSFEVPEDIPPHDGSWDVWVCARCHGRKEDSDPLVKALGKEEAASVRDWLDKTPDLSMESAYLAGLIKGKDLK